MIRQAGFDAPLIQLKVRGRIQESGGRLALQVPGWEKDFRLLGEEPIRLLRQKRGEWGQGALIVGVFQIREASQSPAIQVESWQLAPPD